MTDHDKAGEAAQRIVAADDHFRAIVAQHGHLGAEANDAAILYGDACEQHGADMARAYIALEAENQRLRERIGELRREVAGLRKFGSIYGARP